MSMDRGETIETNPQAPTADIMQPYQAQGSHLQSLSNQRR